MWVQIIFGIIGFLFIVGAIIFAYYINKSTIKLPITKNATIFHNYGRTDFTEGYSEGLVKRDLPRKNGCHFIEFYPTDIKQGEGKRRPNVQSVVIHESNLKRSPEGGISSRRNKLIGVPSDQTKVPQELKGSTLGNYLEKESELAFLQKTFGMTIPQSQKALSKMMKEWTAPGVTEEWLSQIKERIAEELKLSPTKMLQEKDEKTKTP